MSIPKGREYASDMLLMEPDTLDAYFDLILKEDPEAADSLALILVRLWDAIKSGSEGVARAINTLKDATELLYIRTPVHQAAFQLYVLSLQGDLRPPDEPLTLIRGAIERRTTTESPTGHKPSERKKSEKEKKDGSTNG
jgi:hypothetical protein